MNYDDDPCEQCIHKQFCIDNDILPEECEEINFDDPVFKNDLERKWVSDYWNEMSYRKYVEDELDYGDLEDDEEEN